MNKFGWADAAVRMQEYLVRIETPDAYGSGFLINHRADDDGDRPIIATAFHVIEHAHKWAEVIRLTKDDGELVLFPHEIEVLTLESRDLALLVLPPSDMEFPDDPIPLCDDEEILPPGFPVGWSGFPNIAEDRQCFFAGHLSAPLGDSGDYLVDGVVIHGVSGGPAFIHVEDEVTLVGVVSAYFPNRATGEALPGVSLVRSVKPFGQYFRDRNEEVEKEQKRKRRARAKARAKKRSQESSKKRPKEHPAGKGN